MTIDKAETKEDSHVKRVAPLDENVTKDNRREIEGGRSKEKRDFLNPPLSFVTPVLSAPALTNRTTFTISRLSLSRWRIAAGMHST
jgi:hypothetical protein